MTEKLQTLNDKIVWTMNKWFDQNSNLSAEKYTMLKEIVKVCHKGKETKENERGKNL